MTTLRDHNIIPPLPGSRKTLCPMCSHTRVKATRPCLVVDWDHGGWAVRCFNCRYEDWIAA